MCEDTDPCTLTIICLYVFYHLDDCPFGDTPGIIANGQNCTELISSNTANCYQTYYSGKCCGSCSHYHTGISG